MVIISVYKELLEEMKIRQAYKKDLETIRRLNGEEVPNLNSIRRKDFVHFLEIASNFVVVESEEEIAGFMITLREGREYDSLNYQFFINHYKEFEYVDRIVISKKYQGQGLGRKLYEFLFEQTEAKVITCEVNIKPENPKSLGFHYHMGFNEKSKLITGGGEKKVSLLVRKFT